MWELIGEISPGIDWQLSAIATSDWFKFEQVNPPRDAVPMQLAQEADGLFHVERAVLRSGFAQAIHLPSPAPLPADRAIALRVRHARQTIPADWVIRVFEFTGPVAELTPPFREFWRLPGANPTTQEQIMSFSYPATAGIKIASVESKKFTAAESRNGGTYREVFFSNEKAAKVQIQNKTNGILRVILGDLPTNNNAAGVAVPVADSDAFPTAEIAAGADWDCPFDLFTGSVRIMLIGATATGNVLLSRGLTA